MKISDVIAMIVLAIMFTGFTMWYSSNVDASMEEYENCVMVQYGTIPAWFYSDNGYLPECGGNPLRGGSPLDGNGPVGAGGIE